MSGLNALTQCRQDLEAKGVAYLDLTVSNPTLVGLEYPTSLWDAWSPASHLFPYHPLAMGEWPAREAVAHYLREQGQRQARPELIGLTSSTSEAYALLFRMLTQPGDEVIVMTPGYPLCEELLAWSRLKAMTWPWKKKGAPKGATLHFSSNNTPGIPSLATASTTDLATEWTTDWQALEWSLTNQTKAMVLIHPNNPTGYGLSADDFKNAYALAARHKLAVIVDTVFLDYPLAPSPSPLLPTPPSRDALVITLGGLSKTCALPQLKMGWACFDGPSGQVANLMAEWERWADTFLSVNTPVQRFAPHLLMNRESIQLEVRRRIETNWTYAQQLQSENIELEKPQAGWSLPLVLPRELDDEKFCVELLLKENVLVQPGYFFDYDDSLHLVVSLLTQPATFQIGLQKLVRFARPS